MAADLIAFAKAGEPPRPTRTDGVRYGITVYLYSPSTDAEISLEIKSPVHLPPVRNCIGVAEILTAVGHAQTLPALYASAPDWRVMTDEEIRDYRERNDD